MTSKCFTNIEISREELDQIKALADPVRACIYSSLTEPGTVTEIAEHLGVDRKTLYHHVKILKTAGLIEESDTKFVKNLKEVTYSRVNHLNINSLSTILWSEAGSKIITAIQEMDDGVQKAEYRDSSSIATVSRRRLNVKTNRLKQIQEKIIEYREEYCKKVMALADEGEDDLTEIEVMCIFFDR